MSPRIHSDFDAGNIQVLSQQGARFDLAIRRDAHSDFYQWFYFRVDGAAGHPLELRITNASGSAYPQGWRDYRACVSADTGAWLRADTDYADGVLTIRYAATTDSVAFAYFEPYGSDRHAQLVQTMRARHGVRHRVLGHTLDGRPLDLLSIGSGPLRVWLYARQHPGETMAQWWAEGALDLLTGDSALVFTSCST